MALQKTIAIAEDEQQEMFHDSLTEEQLREQLNAQATDTDQESAEAERRMKEGRQPQNQTAKGEGHNPPTQIMKNLSSLRSSRIQMIDPDHRLTENYRA